MLKNPWPPPPATSQPGSPSRLCPQKASTPKDSTGRSSQWVSIAQIESGGRAGGTVVVLHADGEVHRSSRRHVLPLQRRNAPSDSLLQREGNISERRR